MNIQGVRPTMLSAARYRLALAAVENEQRRIAANGTTYYGTKTTAYLEEVIEDIDGGPMDAVVTRNYYGSLVLNAAHALFMDVDFAAPNPELSGRDAPEGRQLSWQS